MQLQSEGKTASNGHPGYTSTAAQQGEDTRLTGRGSKERLGALTTEARWARWFLQNSDNKTARTDETHSEDRRREGTFQLPNKHPMAENAMNGATKYSVW